MKDTDINVYEGTGKERARRLAGLGIFTRLDYPLIHFT